MMRRIKLFFLIVVLLLLAKVSVFAADPLYTNEDSGYTVVIDDGADMVSDEEEKEILEAMKPITEYGNAMFVTTWEPIETAAYAKDLYHKTFRTNSGSLLLIDSYNHYIYLFSDGDINKTVTKQYALTLTDNAYQYASSGDYAQAAIKVFQQEYQLLQKGRILQPMKIVSTLLIAMLCGLLFNFIYLIINRKPMTVTDRNGNKYVPESLKTNFSVGRAPVPAPAPQIQPEAVPSRAAVPTRTTRPRPQPVQEIIPPEEKLEQPVVVLQDEAAVPAQPEPERYRPHIVTYEPVNNPFEEPQPEPKYNLSEDHSKGWEIAGRVGLGILRVVFEVAFELLLGGGSGGSGGGGSFSSGGSRSSSSSSSSSSGSGGGHRY